MIALSKLIIVMLIYKSQYYFDIFYRLLSHLSLLKSLIIFHPDYRIDRKRLEKKATAKG